MQRRAVAVYAALFVLVAGVAGVLTVTADSPEIGFENPDYEVSDGGRRSRSRARSTSSRSPKLRRAAVVVTVAVVAGPRSWRRSSAT